jgi:hypothetical protein
MAAGVTIKIKRKAGAFSNGELAAGELGLDVTNSKLYGSNEGTTVYPINAGLTDIVDDASPQLGANLDAQSNKITNLGTPTSGTDAANKTYVDSAVQGISWEEPVLDIQTDASLDPGASPTTGDRYIITASGTLHANFGTITGVGDNDIVEYDGADFVVDYDASTEGEGGAAYDEDSNATYVFNGSNWVQMGGTADHGGLTGLSDDDHTQYTLISSGAGAPGSTPGRVGELYIDTTGDRAYISTGTASSGDWDIMVSAASTDTLTNKTISSSTNTIDGGSL